MKIALGSDHAGVKIKNDIIKYLQKRRIKVRDFGPYTKESVDYPDYAYAVAKAVAKKKFKFGILICGTGIGMCISANKVKGIRAALCHNNQTAKMAREHNDANVLCLGARVLSKAKALGVVKVFLKTRFAGGRHKRRVKKMMRIKG